MRRSWPGRRPTPCRWHGTSRLDAVRQHQISRPDVGRSRAVRVQQAGVKTDHSRPRQIGPRSVDGGSVSDSQADSAGSIPVTRSMLEYRCSRTVFESSGSLPNPYFGLCLGHCGPQLSTPRDSLISFRGRSACSVMFSAVRFTSLPTSPWECLRKYELDVNGLNDNAAKKRNQ